MNHFTSKYYNLFFTSTLVIIMFIGIIFCIIYSKSFKNKFLIPIDNSKKTFQKYKRNVLVQTYSHELILQNYPEKSVPIQMTLGKIKKVKNPFKPRLNLSFLEKNFVSENLFINLKYRFKTMVNPEDENF